MSIRVVSIITSTSSGTGGIISSDPIDQSLGVFTSVPIMEEAAPFYASASTRLRVTGGSLNGYDGTATWNRIPAKIGTSPSPRIVGDGLDAWEIDVGSFAATECLFIVSYEMASDYAFKWIRDPQKQRPSIVANPQFITSGALGANLYPPIWTFDTYPQQRNPLRYFGYGYGGADGVDSNGFTAAQWRDMRGTYSKSYVAGGATYQYDWTVS